jgi:hypothetical protein
MIDAKFPFGSRLDGEDLTASQAYSNVEAFNLSLDIASVDLGAVDVAGSIMNPKNATDDDSFRDTDAPPPLFFKAGWRFTRFTLHVPTSPKPSTISP